MPAEAGTHDTLPNRLSRLAWIPAFAGMTLLLRRLLAHLRRRPSETRLARGFGLVETAARGVSGCVADAPGITTLRSSGEPAHGGDELVETGLRFRLRRLDQHGAVHHQREVHGHGVVALVDHGLGEVERGDAGAFQPM